MSVPAPPAPGSLNASEVNIFGLHQYDGATAFFTGDFILPQVRFLGPSAIELRRVPYFFLSSIQPLDDI